MNHVLIIAIDYIGTFAFAISGAVAAQQKRLDIFGIMVIAFVTACTGGIIRDVCIGALPPVGLSQWPYLAVSMLAIVVSIAVHKWIRHINYPVLFFDAIGLSFFAIFGAYKTLLFTQNIEMAILLGIATAVGGGVVRDILLNRVPIILHKEIYATAALLAAGLQVTGDLIGLPLLVTSCIASFSCFTLRMLSLHRNWRLPIFPYRKKPDSQDQDHF